MNGIQRLVLLLSITLFCGGIVTQGFAQEQPPGLPPDGGKRPPAGGDQGTATDKAGLAQLQMAAPKNRDYLTADKFGFSGAISFGLGTNLNFPNRTKVADTGSLGLGFNFAIILKQPDPANPNDMKITFNTGLGYQVGMGTLFVNGFTGNRLNITGLNVIFENFFLKGLHLWVGDMVRSSDALFVSGSQYNGDIAFMRGFGIIYTHKNKFNINLDFGGSWQARTSYRNPAEGYEAVNEPVYNSQGYPEVQDYYAFIDDSLRERVRKIYTLRGRIEFPFGGNGYNNASHFLSLNGKLMLLNESRGDRLIDTIGDNYGEIRKEKEILGYQVGYPHETGYTAGFAFTSTVMIREGVLFINKLMGSYNRSLAVTGMGPGGYSAYFDLIIENRTQDDPHPYRQSDRTVNNMMNIIAGDSFQIRVKEDFQITGEFHGLIYSNGLSSASSGGNGFFMGTNAGYAFTDLFGLSGSIHYSIFFPTSGVRAAMLVKHLQTLTFGISPTFSLSGRQVGGNHIALGFSATWYSTGNIPRDPQTGLRITNKLGVWAHWQFAVNIGTQFRW